MEILDYSNYQNFKDLVKKMKMGVYGLKLKGRKAIYIGQSIDIHRRINDHYSSLRNNKHRCSRLQFFYNKGNNEFEILYLEEINNNRLFSFFIERILLKAERKWIDEFEKKGFTVFNIIKLTFENDRIQEKNHRKDFQK